METRPDIEAPAAQQIKIGVWNIAWGVFLGGVLLSLLAFAAWAFFWVLGQMKLQNQIARQQAAQSAQQVIHPAFRSKAVDAVKAIDAEYVAARQGWKAYRGAHATANAAAESLLGIAKTNAESDAAIEIENAESSFNICVEGAIGSFYPSESIANCFSTYPQREIDSALPQ